MITALASERQFIDHLAPIWDALPDRIRGDFLVEPSLMAHALALGIEGVPTPRPVRIPAYPPPRYDGPLMLVASYGDLKVARRLGYGPFVRAEHGAGQSYLGDQNRSPISGSYAGGTDHDDVELFLVPNQQAADRWQAAYPSARVELVGCPRLDSLPHREHALFHETTFVDGDKPVVAISFHWQTPMSLGPEAQTALGEYQGILPDLARRFQVIGHAHPKGDWPERMRRVYEKAGIEFVRDFDDVCRQADVYVCDNSSTLFEFASTGRPVVLLNSRFYRRDVSHGLRFWDAATVGMQVDGPEHLLDTIDAALADPLEQQAAREQALSLVYQPRTNGAAYAATAITDWLTNREQIAA